MEYPLRAITISEDECTYIMDPLLEAELSQSGICHTMSRAIVYEGLQYQSLEICYDGCWELRFLVIVKRLLVIVTLITVIRNLRLLVIVL